jgi:hypothetical protein
MLGAKLGTDLYDVGHLKRKLAEVKPGQYATIHYDLYAVLFPPGEPDENARVSCFRFAREHGCRIENKSRSKEVWFVKDVQRP